MGDKMFYRVCQTVQDYGKYVPVTDNIFDHVDQNKPFYQSIYLYTQEQVEEAQKKVEVEKNGKKYKRPKGIAGITDVKTKKLVFDFDSKDIEDSRQDALEIVNRLVNKGFKEDDLGIFFSGGKGFHVEVEIDTLLTPSQAKSIATKLATGLKTFDSVVYNASRVFRVPYTKHNSSGYYKTRITLDELEKTPLQEVLEIAKEAYEPQGLREVHLPEGLLALASTKEEVEKEYGENALAVMNDKPDLRHNPLQLSAWKNALFQGFFPPGQRSNALMILAATLKARGMDHKQTYHALRSSIEYQADRFGQDKFSKEEFYQNIVTQVFSETWQGGTFSEENFPQALIDYLTNLGVPKVNAGKGFERVTDLHATFDDYATNIDANTIKTGIPGLDAILRMTTSMLVGFLGSPGSGKTATILNMLRDMNASGEKSIFFSMDMGRPLIYQKMAQQLMGWESDYLFKIFDKDNRQQDKIEELRRSIDKNYEHVEFSYDTGCDPDMIRLYIEDYMRNTENTPRLVVVDYLEKVPGPYSDQTANVGYVAKKLQTIANDLAVCVIMLLQPQKMVGDPSKPIKSYRNIKGASIIEQDCRVVVGLWREGYSPETFDNDKFITYAVLKNTMGKLGKVDCYWDGLRGAVSELSEDEKVELEDLRKSKKEIEKISGLL